MRGLLSAAAAIAAVLATVGPSAMPAAAPSVVQSVAPSVASSALPNASAVRYQPPTALHVVRPFSPPASEYGPGHLGVDLSASEGSPVLSAADGAVTFAGPVAGRGLVVVRHADGIRTEYEPMSPSVRVGQTVARGQLLGHVSGRHPGCAAVCLHWGARRGDVYLDPLSLLRPLGPIRLLPWPRIG